MVGNRRATHSFAVEYDESYLSAQFGRERQIYLNNVGERVYHGTLSYLLRRVSEIVCDLNEALVQDDPNAAESRIHDWQQVSSVSFDMAHHRVRILVLVCQTIKTLSLLHSDK